MTRTVDRHVSSSMDAVIRAHQPTVVVGAGGRAARPADPDEATWQRLLGDLEAGRIDALSELDDLADWYPLPMERCTGGIGNWCGELTPGAPGMTMPVFPAKAERRTA